MIDLHIHSTFSDGELIPSEVVSRAIAAGYSRLAITDHADPSNIEFLLERMSEVCARLRGKVRAEVHPGVEITHVPPDLIAPLADLARSRGARVVIVHGETIVEPVPPGTNLAAIKAGVDILAPVQVGSAEAGAEGQATIIGEVMDGTSSVSSLGPVLQRFGLGLRGASARLVALAAGPAAAPPRG